MLVCNNLSKSFGKKIAVDGLSFSVSRGEVFGLLGSNGAGKTTTIKLILGLLKKDGGEISLEEGIKVGYSPEMPFMPPFLTGEETLIYYAKIQGIAKYQIAGEVTKALNTVGLEKGKTKVNKYSKGMLQRLAMAQALLDDSDLLILDEPTAGLDAMGRAEMITTIKRMKQEGKTIMLNSHILNDVERVCDRAIIVNKGKSLYEWSPSESEHRSLEEIFIDTIGGASK